MISDAVQSPCRDCSERKAKCHAFCERYIQYQMDLQQIREELRGKAMADGYTYRMARENRVDMELRRIGKK